MIVDRFLQVFKVKLTGERLFRVYGSEEVAPLPLPKPNILLQVRERYKSPGNYIFFVSPDFIRCNGYFSVDLSSDESSSEDVHGTFLYMQKQAELRNR